MFESSSIPYLTMLAGWSQVVVLIVTARFVWRYLQETAELRRMAQRQVALANEQLEAQIRPAIVARSHTNRQSLMLQNVGNGAAFNLQLAKVDVGASVGWGVQSNFPTILNGAYLEPGVRPEDDVHGAVGAPSYFSRSGLQIRYQSLSGKEYATVVDFDESYRPIQTHFFVKQG